jgi:hypothetical protein
LFAKFAAGSGTSIRPKKSCVLDGIGSRNVYRSAQPCQSKRRLLAVVKNDWDMSLAGVYFRRLPDDILRFPQTNRFCSANEPILSRLIAPLGALICNLEEIMQNRISVGKVLAIFMLLAIVVSAAAAQDKPANVAGSWTVNVSGDTGNAKQTIVLTQDGGKITGTFKGPRQSGAIDGTVDGNNIKFHVTAGIPLDYTGTVDGDSMSGTMTGRGKTGNWKATRAK